MSRSAETALGIALPPTVLALTQLGGGVMLAGAAGPGVALVTVPLGSLVLLGAGAVLGVLVAQRRLSRRCPLTAAVVFLGIAVTAIVIWTTSYSFASALGPLALLITPPAFALAMLLGGTMLFTALTPSLSLAPSPPERPGHPPHG